MLVTTNNINLSTLEFFRIVNLNIVGLQHEEKNEFKKNLNFLKNKNLIFLDKDEIFKKIYSNRIVEDLSIFKNYPSNLKIIIKKTNLLAVTKKENQNYYIGSNGKLILTRDLNNNLPFIFGDVDILNFLKLRELIINSEFNYDQVQNLYYFKSKRWDIETKNGLIIKLPIKDIEKSLQNLSKILISKKFENIKVIDLRQNSQIILND
tara:strand:- start:127 stop:747 length:621 start_codon:yes stop_codon:yes gene_type:complete